MKLLKISIFVCFIVLVFSFAKADISQEWNDFSKVGASKVTITRETAIQIANDFIQKNVSSAIRQEYFLDEGWIKSEGDYWIVDFQRKVNGIPVKTSAFDDRIRVIISQFNGNILSYRVRYGYNATEIDTTHSLSKDQAVFTVLQSYGGRLVEDSKPTLVIVGRRPVYDDIRISVGGGAVRLAIDAKTGETVSFYVSDGTPSVSQVPTKFDPVSYYLQAYGIYVLGAIAIIGGYAFRKNLTFPKK